MYLCEWMFYWHVCMLTMYAPCAYRSQKKALDPQEQSYK